ncbi:MAG TPA: sugar transferase [Bryobacteraceae bacterium]|nr:sugar transferase [Bryobacteraceae bacterium]
MNRSRSLPELLTLALICAGFGASIPTYSELFPNNFDYLTTDEVLLGFFTGVGTFWIAVKLAESSYVGSPWTRLFDEFRIGTGANLIIQALLNYLDILTRSIFLIVTGCLFSALLLALARYLLRARDREVQAGTIIIGFDPASIELARLLTSPVLGVVGDSGPPGMPSWDYGALGDLLEKARPQNILVSDESAGRVDLATLLTQRLRGVAVSSTAELYERLLGRVYCRGREPADLVLSRALSGNARAMALQAIYTNLIGLILLIAASPLIAAVTVATALFSGRGPILETVECLGFQKIPFRRMRFRTKRADGTGRLTRIGALVSRLRLDDLPLLFNIVRGEMALFGPRPVRPEFAARLTEIVPFYALRFAVKPGLMHWSGDESQDARLRRSELIELEYDLYYVKHGSPLLDFEILLRTVFGGGRRQDTPQDLIAAG